MSSEFGWLDHDDSQRRRMLAAIELFKEDGTVDELGIGAVRDTIASVLFPGTSVLHTRARYLLFVPWCVMEAGKASQRAPGRAMQELRKVEVSLIHALLAGDDHEGLIGREARDKLKRLPSAQYWAVLGRWRLRRANLTLEGYLREAATERSAQARMPRAEDEEPMRAFDAVAFDPDLPAAPTNLFERATFELTSEEAAYLADRWRMTTNGSLLPWLLDVSPRDAANIWQHPDLRLASADLQALVAHGHRFSELMHGAALLYNLLLAEQYDEIDATGLEVRYRDALIDWQAGLHTSGTLTLWNRDKFWATVRTHNPRLKRATEVFCEAWIDRCRQAALIGEDGPAREVVTKRELALKGGRARLQNRAALANWKGASGLVRLNYNWHIAARLASDILGGVSGEPRVPAGRELLDARA